MFCINSLKLHAASLSFQVVHRDLVNAIRKKRPEKAEQLENVLFHQDNPSPHVAASTQLEISLLGFDQITHAPYSPDLAPMDFAVFPCIKADLKGLRFSDSEELKRATLLVVRKLDSRWCHAVFNKWVHRHEKCVAMDGKYFEKR